MADNYGFLRKIEHLLQIMFDLQTHTLPAEAEDLRKLALRMGYADAPERSAKEVFWSDYRNKTDLNRRMLDHLLHDAFGDDAETEAEVGPGARPGSAAGAGGRGAGQVSLPRRAPAYRNLMALGEEKIRFLSTRRCRHFLASIAPRLLEAIAATADPDSTLVNLDKVSDSLGGKGVLWELFSFNPPSLRLYVELCAYSPYLCGILTSNPGMIDGLMDSLVLDKLPTRESLRRRSPSCAAGRRTWTRSCTASRTTSSSAWAFATSGQGGRAGDHRRAERHRRGLPGADRRRGIRQALRKFGQPTIGEGPRAGQPCEMVDPGPGQVRRPGDELPQRPGHRLPLRGRRAHRPRVGPAAKTTSNQHFFSELGQRIIKTASRLSPYGRLYEVDARLRPTGKSGALATSLAEFVRYFPKGRGQLWERQTLCKARAVYGSPRVIAAAMAAVARAAFEHRWRRSDAEEIRRMRHRMEETAAGGNLKRGPGGIVDIEFLVQMLQLKHAAQAPRSARPTPWPPWPRCPRPGLLSADDYDFFDGSYRFLRTMEGRLRLMNFTARDKLAHGRDRVGQAGALDARRERGAFAGAANCAVGGPLPFRGALRRRGERAGGNGAEWGMDHLPTLPL